jgi:hypothetical protein
MSLKLTAFPYFNPAETLNLDNEILGQNTQINTGDAGVQQLRPVWLRLLKRVV